MVLSVLELFELTEDVFLINLCFLFWEQGAEGSDPLVPGTNDIKGLSVFGGPLFFWDFSVRLNIV